MTRYENKIGAWISHIYVDDETSVAGGRKIWGLPKEMADFTWKSDEVSIRQGDRLLCRVKHQPSWLNLSTWWQPQFSAEAFGGLDTDLLSFSNQFSSDINLLSARVTISEFSPFASLALGQPWFSFKLNQLNLTAGVPQTVGTKSTCVPTSI